MATNLLELATTVKYLGTKWLLKKKLILCPVWSLCGHFFLNINFSPLQKAGVSKQAGDRRSSAGYLIVCRRLLWSEQSARDKQSWHCFLSLRQHSNFTLNFAAIMHMQKDACVVQKNSNRLLYPVPYSAVRI